MKNKFFLFILLCFFNISLKLYAECILEEANNTCTGIPVSMGPGAITPTCIENWPSGGLYNPGTTNYCIFHPFLSDDQPGCCRAPGCVSNAEFNGYECVCKEGFGVTSDVDTNCIVCSVGTYGPKRTEQDSSNACVSCPQGYLNTDPELGASTITQCYQECDTCPVCPENSICEYYGPTNAGKRYYTEGDTGNCIVPEPNPCTIIDIDCSTGYHLDSGICKANQNFYKTNDGYSEGESSTPVVFTYNDGTTAPENTYERNGYDFYKWQCTGGNESCDGGLIDPGTNISTFINIDGGTITLTAQWTLKTYTITYHPNGGSCNDPGCDGNYTYNVTMLPMNLPTPTKEASFFGGWYNNDNLIGVPIEQITTLGDKTFYAKWTQCSDGTYYNNGVCTDCPNGYYCPSGATTPTACPAGYTSLALSTTQSACYITTGENNTKFCEDNGARCFYLPNVGNIHWGPPQP
ncbi:MAG: InlB B-repeat-containing protein [Alphaproteobacteria bacterium]|jgi:uncharacterized repeat protein (TIGR02543 family)